MRIKDRKLKKKAKKVQEQKIRYKTLLASGVKNTPENRQRYLDGEALDLFVEAIEEREKLNIKYDSVTNKVTLSKDYLEQLEQSEQEALEELNKEEDG